MNPRTKARIFRQLLICTVAAGVVLFVLWQQHMHSCLNVELIAAIKENREDKVVSLLAHGADPDCRDSLPDERSVWQRIWSSLRGRRDDKFSGHTALLTAVRWREDLNREYPPENTAIAIALLERGANPNVKDEGGWTPLMMASTCEKERTVALLLRYGADPNIQDPGMGTTALMFAVMADNEREVIALLHAKADPNLRETYDSPLSLALTRSGGPRNRIAEILKRAGARTIDRSGRFRLQGFANGLTLTSIVVTGPTSMGK